MRTMVSAVVAALAVTAGAPAFAAPETAEQWYSKAVEYRLRDKPEKALEAIRQAHALAPSAKTRGQMGFIEGELGMYVPSEEHLLEALVDDSDPWVRRNHKALEEGLALTKRHVAHLSISGPAGATVAVQDVVVGTLPLRKPLTIAEGETTVRVTSPGHLPWVQRMSFTGGKDTEVTVDLVPDRRELPDLQPKTPAANQGNQHLAGSGGGGPVPILNGSTDNSGSSKAGRSVGIGLVAGGLVAVAVGAFVLRNRADECHATNQMCLQLVRPSSAPGWALIGGGAGAAVLCGVLIFVSRDVEVAAAPSPHAFVLALKGTL